MMKNTLLFCFLLLFALPAFAQKKEKKAKPTLQEQIVGTWTFQTASGFALLGADVQDAMFAERLATNMNQQSERVFNADGTYQRKALDLEKKTFVRKGTWKLEGKQLIMTETEGDGKALPKENVLKWDNVSVRANELIVEMPYDQGSNAKGKVMVKATFARK